MFLLKKNLLFFFNQVKQEVEGVLRVAQLLEFVREL
jgi:hypothetical protein